MIRLTVPSIDQTDLDAVADAVSSGFLTQGAHVAAFESAVAERVGVAHAVAVANGTCALQIALAAVGVGQGDICIIPAYSWIATANVVELCGARPIFVDIDPETFNMDVGRLSNTLRQLLSTDRAKVKAVIPVHAFGQMAPMQEINSLCRGSGIPVIEDAACALGASINGTTAGGSSTLGCFSFHPRKAVTTGEGGMVVTNDSGLAKLARSFRNHGIDPDSSPADFVVPGYNFRLTEFQGALGVTQLAKLDRIIARRQQAAARYDALLADSMLVTPRVIKNYSHVFQSYVTLIPDDRAKSRGDVIAAAKEQGVELQIGTIHMPMTTYYRKRYNYKPGDFPVTDSIARRSLTLPLFENITADEQQTVVDVVTGLLS